MKVLSGKGDTTKCVFQEDSSGGAAVPPGEMRNMGRKRLLRKQLVQVSDGRVGPRILRSRWMGLGDQLDEEGGKEKHPGLLNY